jgi:hypothetical protein
VREERVVVERDTADGQVQRRLMLHARRRLAARTRAFGHTQVRRVRKQVKDGGIQMMQWDLPCSSVRTTCSCRCVGTGLDLPPSSILTHSGRDKVSAVQHTCMAKYGVSQTWQLSFVHWGKSF